MHCCVGGISAGTPTLFITYSNKGKGMAYYAYGHHDFEIECNHLGDKTFITKINLMLEEKNSIRNHLQSQYKRFIEDAYKAGNLLISQK